MSHLPGCAAMVSRQAKMLDESSLWPKTDGPEESDEASLAIA